MNSRDNLNKSQKARRILDLRNKDKCATQGTDLVARLLKAVGISKNSVDLQIPDTRYLFLQHGKKHNE